MKTLFTLAIVAVCIQINAAKLLVDSKTGALIAVFPKDIPRGFRIPPGTVVKDKPVSKANVKKVVPADVQKARDERRAKHLAEIGARKTNSLPTRLMAPKSVKP